MKHKIKGLLVGFVMGALLAAGAAYAAEARVGHVDANGAATQMAAVVGSHMPTDSVTASHSAEPGSGMSTMTAGHGTPQHSQMTSSHEAAPMAHDPAHTTTATPEHRTTTTMTRHTTRMSGGTAPAPDATQGTQQGPTTTDGTAGGTQCDPTTTMTQQRDGTACATSTTTCAGRTGMNR